MAVWITGGAGGRLLGVAIASRDPVRPLLSGFAAAIVYGWAFRRNFSEDTAWSEALGRTVLAPLSVTLAVATFALGIAWGTFVASGADSYGYVSQANLWLSGQLRMPQTWVGDFPWPDVDWTFSPLGYRPATIPHAIVPAYASGLPLLMAAAQGFAGPSGSFYVVPLLGAVAVWLTYKLGRDWTNRHAVGALAAVLLAVSPTFLYQLMWPMTDVPVAALWAAAFLAAFHSRRPRPFAAGLAAAAAVLVRPNLILMALALPVGWLLPTVRRSSLRRDAAMTTAWYVAGLMPGIVSVAAIDLYLYGSPLASGYGSLTELYSARNVAPNVGLYSRWLIETQTPLVCLGLLALAIRQMLRSDDEDRVSRRGGFCAVAIVIAISYLTYGVFDAWSYLRFFLPIFPLMLTLVAAAGVWLMSKVWRPIRVPLALFIVVSFAAYEITIAADRMVFNLKRREHRYVDSAGQVASLTPASAIVLSMQHSGSVRYYAGRQTLRYDLLAPEWLDRAVAALNAKGFRCYAVLDSWEEPIFRARFNASTRLGRLDWKPVAEVPGPIRVRLFELDLKN